MIVDATAPWSCLPCRGSGTAGDEWCPACDGRGTGWTELDGDGTAWLWDAWLDLLDAGLDPRWIGLDRRHNQDGVTVETWRVYGARLWAVETTLARAIEVVLSKADVLAAEGV